MSIVKFRCTVDVTYCSVELQNTVSTGVTILRYYMTNLLADLLGSVQSMNNSPNCIGAIMSCPVSRSSCIRFTTSYAVTNN